jgi:hypothetical protein
MRCLKGTHVTQTIVTTKKTAGKERIERRKENVIVHEEMIKIYGGQWKAHSDMGNVCNTRNYMKIK